ncbi:hypothetical protein ACFQ0B_14110 [Nonomuraea thailandensis]
MTDRFTAAITTTTAVVAACLPTAPAATSSLRPASSSARVCLIANSSPASPPMSRLCTLDRQATTASMEVPWTSPSSAIVIGLASAASTKASLAACVGSRAASE